MKILVSGAGGFVGTHLLPRLKEKGYSVVAVKRGETSIEELTRLMEEEKVGGIVHLASSFIKDHRPEDVPGLIESNVLLGTALLEAASASGVLWFINTGSYWQHYEDASYSPVNLYAATKQAFEDIGQFYAEARGIDFVTLTLFDNFGEGDTRPKIFNLWQKAMETGEKLEMSPGEQIIDIIYIENVIEGYLRAIDLLSQDTAHELAGKSFALSGERMSLQDLARTFEKVTGRKLTIAWGAKPYRAREVMVPWQKGEPLPGWEPRIPLEEGIRRTFSAPPSGGKKSIF